jgi:Arc/MetJ-type ribon-helix-helix transcriptional regulator
MNFSVHLNDEMVRRLNRTAKESGRTRNALIREAVADWLAKQRPAQWPAEVASFRGVGKFKRFEDAREELEPPRAPFDAISS